MGGMVAVRFRQPAVFGELLAGVLLGPTFLALPRWDLFPGSDSLDSD
jgi:Kef-type K+ transport system membrane component KefB